MYLRAAQQRTTDRIISVALAGFFFILVGALFISTPGLTDRIVAFFRDFTLVKVPNTENVFFPVPATTSAYVDLYRLAQEFSLIWGVIQIFILVLRLATHSSTRRIAENVGDVVFPLGNSYLIGYFLTQSVTVIGWFVYWSMVITLLGVSLVARAIVIAVLPR